MLASAVRDCQRGDIPENPNATGTGTRRPAGLAFAELVRYRGNRSSIHVIVSSPNRNNTDMNARRSGMFSPRCGIGVCAQAVVQIAADRAIPQHAAQGRRSIAPPGHSTALFEIRVIARRCSNIWQRSMSFRAGLTWLLVR
jgi:hypothetical protein